MDVDPDSGLTMDELLARKRELNRERMRRWREKKRQERQTQLALGVNHDEMQARIQKDREKARERARLWREKKRNELTCSLSPESLETIMNDRNETDRIRMQQWRDKKRKAATIDESSKKSNEQDAITSQWVNQYLQMANGMAMMNGYPPMMNGTTPLTPMTPNALPLGTTPKSLPDSLTTEGQFGLDALIKEQLAADLPKMPTSNIMKDSFMQSRGSDLYGKNQEDKRNPLQLLTDVALNLSRSDSDRSMKADQIEMQSPSNKYYSSGDLRINGYNDRDYDDVEYDEQSLDLSKPITRQHDLSKPITHQHAHEQTVEKSFIGRNEDVPLKQEQYDRKMDERDTHTQMTMLSPSKQHLVSHAMSEGCLYRRHLYRRSIRNSIITLQKAMVMTSSKKCRESSSFGMPSNGKIALQRYDVARRSVKLCQHQNILASNARKTLKCLITWHRRVVSKNMGRTRMADDARHKSTMNVRCVEIISADAGDNAHHNHIPLESINQTTSLSDLQANPHATNTSLVYDSFNTTSNVCTQGADLMPTDVANDVDCYRKTLDQVSPTSQTDESTYSRQDDAPKPPKKRRIDMIALKLMHNVETKDEIKSPHTSEDHSRNPSPFSSIGDEPMQTKSSNGFVANDLPIQPASKSMYNHSKRKSCYDDSNDDISSNAHNRSRSGSISTPDRDTPAIKHRKSSASIPNDTASLIEHLHKQQQQQLMLQASLMGLATGGMAGSLPGGVPGDPGSILSAGSAAGNATLDPYMQQRLLAQYALGANPLMASMFGHAAMGNGASTPTSNGNPFGGLEKAEEMIRQQQEAMKSLMMMSGYGGLSHPSVPQSTHHTPRRASVSPEQALELLGGASDALARSTAGSTQHESSSKHQSSHSNSVSASKSCSTVTSASSTPIHKPHTHSVSPVFDNPTNLSKDAPLDFTTTHSTSQNRHGKESTVSATHEKGRRNSSNSATGHGMTARNSTPELTRMLTTNYHSKEYTESNAKEQRKADSIPKLTSMTATAPSTISSSREHKNPSDFGGADINNSTGGGSEEMHTQHMQMMQYFYYQQQLQAQAAQIQASSLQQASQLTNPSGHALTPEFRAQQDKREKARIQMRKYRAKKRQESDTSGVQRPVAETDSEKRKLNAERMRRWREKKRIQATLAGHQAALGYSPAMAPGMNTTSLMMGVPGLKDNPGLTAQHT